MIDDKIFDLINQLIKSNKNTQEIINELVSNHKLTNSQASSAVRTVRKKLNIYNKTISNKSNTVVVNPKIKDHISIQDMDNEYDINFIKNKKHKKLSYDK